MAMFPGRGRKVALPFLILSGVGWLVFIVGFGRIESQIDDITVSADDLRDWYWAFAVGTPLFYCMAFLTLLSGQWYIGMVSNFAAAFALVAGGSVLYGDGLVIKFARGSLTDTELGRHFAAEFAGCLVATFFMAIYLMTWPFYTNINSYECIGYHERPTTGSSDNYPTTYTPVAVQPGIPMQPVIFQSQAYPQHVVYPVSSAAPMATSAPKEQ